ncbi:MULTISPECIES: hypothetical protein [Ensifer]|uniref:Putative ATPase n=1 Tax=Ensifer adhaerens TaxID=106592 RepID=D1CSG7_ENSAD|nr:MULTISPECIES: hypothetical protein [Ensifer]ABD74771.1 putative ATPase [Ensifer adhaerens]WFP95361.1 hypothetical protein P4B07_30480 [Ensifer adhaerens]
MKSVTRRLGAIAHLFNGAGKRLSADRLIIPDALLALSAATAIEPQVETWRKQPLRRPFSSALQLIGCDI